MLRVQILASREAGSASPAKESESPPCIRRARRGDLSQIVRLQTICLPHFPISEPGPAFLRTFYSCLVRDPRGVLLVSEHDHKLAAFIAGYVGRSWLDERLATRKFHVCAAALACALRHPIQLPRLLIDLRRACRLKYEAGCRGASTCELVTIAVQPRLRRQGHGKALIAALVETARRNGIGQVRVYFSADDDGTSLFYRRFGFEPYRTFRASDARWRGECVLAISNAGTSSR